MYNQFIREFRSEDSISSRDNKTCTLDTNSREYPGLIELFSEFEGKGFNDGLYRIINIHDSKKWCTLLQAAHPKKELKIIPFGYDWLGRFYCINKEFLPKEEPEIYLFCPFTSDILEVPANTIDFHNKMLLEQETSEALLEKTLFKSFVSNKKIASINHEDCVGLQVPQFLNGELTIENMEVVKLETYWDITGQLLRQAPWNQ